jgi:hypothetical protein
MAENQPRIPTPSEMIEPWRQMAERLEQQWNQFFNQMMGTESFANLLSAYLQSYLTLQQSIAQSVEHSFQALNLPVRSDIVGIAERIAALEGQIAALAAEQRKLAAYLEDRLGTSRGQQDGA